MHVLRGHHYQIWEEQGFTFCPGLFGENLSVTELSEDEVGIGDVFTIGEAEVQVSQPRQPCHKLAKKIGDLSFSDRVIRSGLTGFYFRVLEEGEVGSGDEIELVSRDPRRMTIREVNDLLFFDKENLDGTRVALSIPALSHGWKGSFEERLAKAEKANKTTHINKMYLNHGLTLSNAAEVS